MENKARYTLVGLFLILFSSAMVIFILWLARYDLEEMKAKEYRLYSEVSVAGLNKNSIIEYKGLDIGTVDEIKINPSNLEQIEIILKVKNPELIKEDSFAVIQSQGVTGNKYIEIDGGTKDSPVLKQTDKGFAIIPLKKSFFDKLTNSADNISFQIENILNKFDKLLNENNMKNLEQTLKNLNTSTNNFNTTVTKVNGLLDDSISKTIKSINGMATSIDTVVKKDISKTLTNINDLSEEVKQIVNDDVKTIIKDLKNTSKSTQDIEKVLNSLENTLEKIDSTVDDFNQNGGDMIFKTREVKYGPGEKSE